MKTTIDLVNDDIWVLTRIFLEKKTKINNNNSKAETCIAKNTNSLVVIKLV